ncbi:unnamed protein product [Prunus armeniaca]
MPSEPYKLILQYAMDWFTACKPMLSSLKKCVVQVHCHAPLPGFVKLNTNRSGKSDSGAIGTGGLIRNSTGDCITGFAINQGVGSTLEAEFWGIFWGLHLAWDSGCRHVEVECDSNSVVSLLTGSIASTHPLFSLIDCCKLKMHQIDLYGKIEPWDIWNEYGGHKLAIGEDLYFFTKLKSVKNKDSYVARTIGSDTWKGENSGTQVDVLTKNHLGMWKRFHYENPKGSFGTLY